MLQLHTCLGKVTLGTSDPYLEKLGNLGMLLILKNIQVEYCAMLVG